MSGLGYGACTVTAFIAVGMSAGALGVHDPWDIWAGLIASSVAPPAVGWVLGRRRARTAS